jgi:hypothetical protein
MRVWVIRIVIALAVLVMLAPVVAYVIDSRTRVTGQQMTEDMRTLRVVVEGMGPDFKGVAVNITPNRQQIQVTGTVGSQADHDRLRAALKQSKADAKISAPLSRVTFDVKVTGNH